MKLTDPSTICLILLAATAIFLLIRTRGRLARQRQRAGSGERGVGVRAPRSTLRAPGSSLSADLEYRVPVPDDFTEWEVEMHETARRLCGQLDAKLSLLQSMIVEADRAAARLEDALQRAYPALPPGSQAESLRPAAGQARDVRYEPQSEPHAQAGDFGVFPLRTRRRRHTDRARRRDEIYRLADYGFAAPEIARRVGSPVGEVELILSLRDSK